MNKQKTTATKKYQQKKPLKTPKKKKQKKFPKFLSQSEQILMSVPIAGGTVMRVSHFSSDPYSSSGYKTTALPSQSFQSWKHFSL